MWCVHFMNLAMAKYEYDYNEMILDFEHVLGFFVLKTLGSIALIDPLLDDETRLCNVLIWSHCRYVDNWATSGGCFFFSNISSVLNLVIFVLIPSRTVRHICTLNDHGMGQKFQQFYSLFVIRILIYKYYLKTLHCCRKLT